MQKLENTWYWSIFPERKMRRTMYAIQTYTLKKFKQFQDNLDSAFMDLHGMVPHTQMCMH